jgi:hypothetical protein
LTTLPSLPLRSEATNKRIQPPRNKPHAADAWAFGHSAMVKQGVMKIMENVMPFGEVLEAVDKLSLEEQEALVGVLHRRLIERRREELAKDVQQAQQEFEAGQCRPVMPADLMKEIVS